jgi:hypothetical protein
MSRENVERIKAGFAFVFTFKGDRVAREQAFRNREEALEAAGLSPSQDVG